MMEQTNYQKYRGKCKEFCEELIAKDPSLRMVRGHYWCPVSNKDEPHWWCIDKDGTIIDPTKLQFLSSGYGTYTEFDGIVVCVECGKEMSEQEAAKYSHGNYGICSSKCYGSLVGVPCR